MNNDQNFLDDSIFKTIEDYQLASAGRRFTNFIIDLIAIIVMITIVIYLFRLVIREVFLILKAIGLTEGVIIFLFLMFHYFGYYFIFETLTKGRTIGKLITKTRVVSTTSSEITIKHYAIRAICRLIPFEPVSIVEGGEMWHDSLAKTKVVSLNF